MPIIKQHKQQNEKCPGPSCCDAAKCAEVKGCTGGYCAMNTPVGCTGGNYESNTPVGCTNVTGNIVGCTEAAAPLSNLNIFESSNGPQVDTEALDKLKSGLMMMQFA
jgi:hypothetical protein